MAGARRLRLLVRREVLLQRSTALRGQIGLQAQPWRRPLAWADRARDGLGWLREHPEWPVGAGVALLVMRPKRLLRWTVRGWAVWRLWRRWAPWVQAARGSMAGR